jgi:hypothetical protein
MVILYIHLVSHFSGAWYWLLLRFTKNRVYGKDREIKYNEQSA